MKTLSFFAVAVFAMIFAAGCKKSVPAAAPAVISSATAVSGIDEYVPAENEYGTVSRCPINGEKVIVGKNTPALKYKGRAYYFCCPECLSTFKSNPAVYVK